MKLISRILVGFLTLLPTVAMADELNSGDTAWMITATALVLFMTIPGLSLFYAGMVRSKNALSVMMQCFAVTCVSTLIWFAVGYSLAFGEGNAFWGGFEHMFLAGIDPGEISGTIPTYLFVIFQMTFAIITPALIAGAFAERMKFSAMLIFSAVWVVLVYSPVCHWVWGGGYFADDGVLDFAGGTVVHINAGVAGLVAAIMVGKRKGYPTVAMPPHSLMMTMVGTGMLWVGWFGFNAGSQLAADTGAASAMLVTQISTAAAAVVWMLAEWIKHGKASALGIASGAIAGLVAITPAAGFVGPTGAFFIGAISGFICFISVTVAKRAFGYDDSLDAFGVHGVGGIVGAMLTGVFCATQFGGTGFGSDDINSIGGQVAAQGFSVIVTLIYSAVASGLILFLIDKTIGLRVSKDEEQEGLDVSQHGEAAYTL